MAGDKVVKIPDDIEFRVIGNSFGLLIASAGLLGGSMMHQRSFEYWLDDILPLSLATLMAFRLFRTFLATMTAYQDYVPPPRVVRDRQVRETLKSEQAAVGQITAKTGLSPEQVVEEVVKRIEKRTAEASSKNKFTH